MRERISANEYKALQFTRMKVYYTRYYLLGFIKIGKTVGYSDRRSLKRWCRWLTRIEYEV